MSKAKTTITKEEQIKLKRRRTMVQQKPKIQTNKKVYKRDKTWKKQHE